MHPVPRINSISEFDIASDNYRHSSKNIMENIFSVLLTVYRFDKSRNSRKWIKHPKSVG